MGLHITFLIGNGFDINLGLKSRYIDFLNEYSIVKETDNNVIINFKKEIEEFIKMYCHKVCPRKDDINWADAESAFGQFTNNFNGEAGKSFSEFIECYNNFYDALGDYLESQVAKMEFSQPQLDKKFAGCLEKITNGLTRKDVTEIDKYMKTGADGYIYDIISFNYTYLIDSLVELLREKKLLGRRYYNGQYFQALMGKVLHNHGCTDNNMIFGVNDETQIANIKLFEGQDDVYLKNFIKSQALELAGEMRDEEVSQLLGKSHLIYIYGMSLGKTDKRVWANVCALMKNNLNLRIIIYSHEVPRETRNIIPFRLFEKTLKERFLCYCDYETDIKESISNRIFVTRENIFEDISNSLMFKQSNNN